MFPAARCRPACLRGHHFAPECALRLRKTKRFRADDEKHFFADYADFLKEVLCFAILVYSQNYRDWFSQREAAWYGAITLILRRFSAETPTFPLRNARPFFRLYNHKTGSYLLGSTRLMLTSSTPPYKIAQVAPGVRVVS
jgi:hypothetical protein